MPANSAQKFIQQIIEPNITASDQINELENQLRQFIEDINTNHLSPLVQARDKATKSIETMTDRMKRLHEENANEQVIRDQQSRLSTAEQQLIQLKKLIRSFEDAITQERERIRYEQQELIQQSSHAPTLIN